MHLIRCFNRFKYVFNDIPKDIYCWISGGCLCDYFDNDRKFKDIDVFFEKEDEKNIVKNIFKNKYKFLCETNLFSRFNLGKEEVELIFAQNKISPISCIRHHDFSVCCVALDINRNFYYHEKFFEDIKNKNLRKITFESERDRTRQRLRRYRNKGFRLKNKNHEDDYKIIKIKIEDKFKAI